MFFSPCSLNNFQIRIGDAVCVLLGEHTFLEQGRLATVKKVTNTGYVVEVSEQSENSSVKQSDHTVYASDVFPQED